MKTISLILVFIFLKTFAICQTANVAYTVIPIDSARSQGYFSKKTGTNATLNQNELAKIEYLLFKATDYYSLNERWAFRSNNRNNHVTPNFTIHLEHYNQQIIPYINKKGEKEVIVNCINTGAMLDRDWRKYIVYRVIIPPYYPVNSIVTFCINLKQNCYSPVNINYFTAPSYGKGSSYFSDSRH